MNELAVLIKRSYAKDADGKLLLDDSGKVKVSESTREVFCSERSIGQKEFYQAHGTDFRPELKLILPDYLEYEGEKLVDYNGQRYRVLRTYRTGYELELTLERAPKEDGEADG